MLIKTACRLNLACTYRVLFSAKTCQAELPRSSPKCTQELGLGEQNTGVLCAASLHTHLEILEEKEAALGQRAAVGYS